jgi:outer membrane lipoprotein SlyB
MFIARLIAGLALLVLGRNLFWLVVALIGFAAAATLATSLFQGQPEALLLLIAVVAGIIGALLAVTIERIAAALAGGLAGGVLLTGLANLLGLNSGNLSWVLFVVGAVAGALAVIVLQDWALIVLTSATGATLIAQSFALELLPRLVVFGTALALGVIVQARMMERRT